MKIELKNVYVIFEKGTELEKTALKGISLSFTTNERILLVGNTGSGKTTLIYLLDLLLKPSFGTILYDGVNPFEEAYNFRRKLGVAFQIPERQFFSETVEEEVTYVARNFDVPYNKDDLLSLLRKVGLQDSVLKSSPFRLSGGEQRKVAIASILIHKPEFLIFDEPTAGLDLKGIFFIRDILKTFKDENKGFLIATHEPEVFRDLCERKIVLENGRILEDVKF
ncbi:MAG: energy-coupling factor ABC transporter ATP-binding protein [Fervidobacterium sp.]|nr:energy-coupling factor ABC transporter ATP-binding protein [Fervidobacterium sp.]